MIYYLKIYAVFILIMLELTLVAENKRTSVPIIDLTKIPKNEQNVKMSSFASEVKYLPLESTENCIIVGGPRFFHYDSFIIVCAHRQIMVFNAENGKFIRQISDHGHGPSEFVNSTGSYLKNGEIIITAVGWDSELIEFSIDGKMVNKIKASNYPREKAWLTDDLYVFNYIKRSNSDSVLLQVYDSKNAKVLKTFKDDREFLKTNRIGYCGAFFHRHNSQLFMKECFMDTIFRITKQKMLPVYVFNSGKFSPPYYEKDKADLSQFHFINPIIQSDNWLFFVLHFKKQIYNCFFDKRTQQVSISYGIKTENIGYENDVDGFVPFIPQTLNENNELVGYVYPYRIRQWFNDNPDKAAKLSPELKKFRNISNNDNPVLMLVKLKE
jgi:hypothetical protein